MSTAFFIPGYGLKKLRKILVGTLLASMALIVLSACFWLGPSAENDAYRFLTCEVVRPDAWGQTTGNEITHHLIARLDLHLISLKTTGVGIILVGAVLFLWNTRKKLCEWLECQEFWCWLPCILFSFFCYCFSGLPEYNHYLFFCTCLLIGLVLRWFPRLSSLDRMVPLAVLVGVIASLKLTSGFCLAVLTAWLMTLSSSGLGATFKTVGSFFAGVGLITLLSFRIFQGEWLPSASMPANVFPELMTWLESIWPKELGGLNANIIYAFRVLSHSLLELLILAVLLGLCFFVARTVKGVRYQQRFHWVICLLVSCWTFASLFVEPENKAFLTVTSSDSVRLVGRQIFDKLIWYARTSLPVLLLLVSTAGLLPFRQTGKQDRALRIFMFLVPFAVGIGTYARLSHYSVIYTWLWWLVFLGSFVFLAPHQKSLRAQTLAFAFLILLFQFLAQCRFYFTPFSPQKISNLMVSCRKETFYGNSTKIKRYREVLLALQQTDLTEGSQTAGNAGYFLQYILGTRLKVLNEKKERQEIKAVFLAYPVNPPRNNMTGSWLTALLWSADQPFLSIKMAGELKKIISQQGLKQVAVLKQDDRDVWIFAK